MGALAYQLFPISNITRELRFDIRRYPCCGEYVDSVDELQLKLFREGKEADEDLLITYNFFYVHPETGELCIILDDAIDKLCRGRYIGYIYHQCVLIDRIRLQLGAEFTVQGVNIVDSKAPDCPSHDPLPGECVKIVEPKCCCADSPETKNCCTCHDTCTGECLKWQEDASCP